MPVRLEINEGRLIELWVRGYTRQEIADSLGVSFGRVKSRVGLLIRRGVLDSRPRSGTEEADRKQAQAESERLRDWDARQEAGIQDALDTIARNSQLAKEGRLQ